MLLLLSLNFISIRFPFLRGLTTCYSLILPSLCLACSQGSIIGRDSEERLSIRRDKNHVLFGGTKILQHTPDKVGYPVCLLISGINIEWI